MLNAIDLFFLETSFFAIIRILTMELSSLKYEM
jgi:hypothetical protein